MGEEEREGDRETQGEWAFFHLWGAAWDLHPLALLLGELDSSQWTDRRAGKLEMEREREGRRE